MISLIIAIILSFLPLIISFFCFKKQFKPLHLLLATILGFVIVLPISFVQYLVPNNIPFSFNPILFLLLKSLLLYGLLEEGFKLLVLLPFSEKKDTSPKKVLIISLMISLAVAGFESIIYFLDKLQKSNYRNGTLLYLPIFLRLCSAYIIHITCTCLSSLFLYTLYQKKAQISLFLLAIILHGLYDFFVAFQNNFKWFSIGIILLSLIELKIKYSTFLEKNP